ncbi:4'-phosphopantetheinyl transferase family protein [Vibrio splendidus]|uniref:4'-phosphopantetheinyl transferase family protein n=1 Tax=Vibrio splendidus TaxID=29497 RepID=UPI002468476A|nr:4'-phosphopantetheinyl transferase superfamily protein [Vibrio splendidus]MDH5917974.1 4'-phosphopantetheinyl transferase superfamily protein [Vibrio splendidus]
MINESLSPFITGIEQLIFDGVPVVCRKCTFNPIYYSESLAIELLGTDLSFKLSHAVLNRKAEFLAGRILAISLLNDLQYSNLKVDIGANRAPVWPVSAKGSISHANQIAICAVSTEKLGKRIGIDVEPLDSEVSTDLIETILSEFEEDLLTKYGFVKSIAFSFAFSAKESLFKAIFPEVNYYFGFESATVNYINVNENIFKIILNVDLNDTFTRGMEFSGRYVICECYLVTLIID